MTREEAIFILMLSKSQVCNDELTEALDMAIEALKQEPCRDCVDREKVTEILEYYYDKDSDGYKQAFKSIVEDLESVKPQITTDTITEYCKEHNYVLCEKGTEEDAISRQAVNVLIDELARAISDERCCVSRGRNTATIMQDILDLPSVTPTHGKMLVCPNCGLDVHSDFENCPRCGERMKNETDN